MPAFRVHQGFNCASMAVSTCLLEQLLLEQLLFELAGVIMLFGAIVVGAQDRSYLLECRYIFLLGFFTRFFFGCSCKR